MEPSIWRTPPIRAIEISFVNLGWSDKYDDTGNVRTTVSHAPSIPIDSSWVNRPDLRLLWQEYTQPQINAAVNLVSGLVAQFPTLNYIVGHEDIQTNKVDPGPLFDKYYPRFERLGLVRGPAPESEKSRDTAPPQGDTDRTAATGADATGSPPGT